jgi:twinkle protein
MADAQLRRGVDRFLDEHFIILDGSLAEGEEEDQTLEWVLERAHDSVHRHGIRHLIIDPWNEVEHAKPPHESMPDYIGRGIRMLKRFAKERQIHVTVIAHPTKAVGGEKPRAPNLYDIEGSAHWYNKPDLGVVVFRDPDTPHATTIRVSKVRFDETGARGDVLMAYDEASCRFTQLDQVSPGGVRWMEAAE